VRGLERAQVRGPVAVSSGLRRPRGQVWPVPAPVAQRPVQRATGAPTGSEGVAAVVVAAGGVPAAVVVGPSLESSSMLRESSATRVDDSWACRSWAILSSLALCPAAPLDRVSLSCADWVGFLSSTSVWTLPDAWRSAAATAAAGTEAASRRRNSLKSRLWAATICRASVRDTSMDEASVGRSRTAPALTRLTLFPMKALGLARNMATSIWSSEALAGRLAAAMRPAVSPALTVTLREAPLEAPVVSDFSVAAGWSALAAGAAAARAGGATARAVAAGADGAAAAAGAGGLSAAAVAAFSGAGAGAAVLGGSNSSVYSRTSRPAAQLASSTMSTNGSLTGREPTRLR
jgi:hypothetical protein